MVITAAGFFTFSLQPPRPSVIAPVSRSAHTAVTLRRALPVSPRRTGKRPAMLLGRLHDLDRLHLVADADLVHDLHARGDLAEHGVLAVEEVSRRQRDVELAARRVGALAAGHGEDAADVLLLVELGLDGIAGTAHAIALGIAA